MKRRLWWLTWGLSAALAACAPAPPTASPAAAEVDATAFVATRVAVILTESAPPPATMPPPTGAAPASATPSATAAPPPTETSAPATPSPAPFPTLELSRFPRPPAAFGGDAHFYFQRPIGAGGNVFPASNYRYGSTYNHQLETHHGEEFANPLGVAVVAVAAGTVYYAGSDLERQFGPQLDFYGNLVVLQAAQPWFGRPVFALYGHLDTVNVQTGQAVAAGEVLGTVGATGVAYGPHLHLEVRVDNPDSYWATRNPELWLMPAAGHGAVALRVTNADNQYLPGLRVSVLCSDGAKRFVDTYWDPGVTPDDVYGENAALTDLPAGYCEFETDFEGTRLTATTTVQAGAVNFVWLQP